eukprot:GFKZ01015020.1.p1 GENE.GFKZ01015020.1~~GFKZ01015020.1.p1  ORF type:complete len:415 (-),score=50.43 GFKZ01015020.1:665-1909(-)
MIWKDLSGSLTSIMVSNTAIPTERQFGPPDRSRNPASMRVRNQYCTHAYIKCALLGEDLASCDGGADSSIYERVKKYLDEPDSSLDPAPEINSILSELVSLLQGATTTHTLEDGLTFADVARCICDEIDNNELLEARASAIRTIAIRSETRLELYWASLLANNHDVVNPTSSTIEKVRAGTGGFPYVENYVSMVQTEAEVIKAQMAAETERLRPKKLRVAFCGSGPLPLTGILLSACLDAQVTLIDNDEKAVELSQKLVNNWERRGITPAGRIDIVCADGGQIRFFRGGRKGISRDGVGAGRARSIECDILFVAALIPNQTKEEIARNVAEMRQDGPLVVVRTAHGLTARFAYFQNRRNVIEKYLNFSGLVVPELHEFGDGRIVDDDVKPIGLFPRDILNSLEIFGWKAGMAKS